MTIEEEIQQSAFASEFEKAIVNLQFTHSWLYNRLSKSMKHLGISKEQFNILKILRGQHPNPATIKLISERMINRDSNASRMVQKLYEKGLVRRYHCDSDRRAVDLFISEKGLKLLEEAEAGLQNSLKDLRFLGDADYAKLNALLDSMRG